MVVDVVVVTVVVVGSLVVVCVIVVGALEWMKIIKNA